MVIFMPVFQQASGTHGLLFQTLSTSPSLPCPTLNPPLLLYLEKLVSLLAQGVLVDGNHLLVLEQPLGLGADVPQVVGHEQGSGHDGPHGHLSHRLVPAQPKVSNHQL